ncbi:MAG: sulfite exporter TauE/SafE family protein [Candidatus Omnitrophica bacterium]|nr:sulfite exporter TauE/SafE family protein [Candidatus Omnitrophota bacterium]
MPDNLITHLQVFWIGFSFASYGPCLLVCMPVMITYITARQKGWGETAADITVFLSGRLFAYIILGAIAGLSGFYLRRFIETDLTPYFNLASGVISILLGIFVFMYKETKLCACNEYSGKVYNSGSLLALGFLVGISPCGPLTALLFEIALISRSAFEGASYAFSFGLGTFLAGIIVIASLTGIFKGFARKIFRSKTANSIFRISCSAILILFGLGLIRAGIKAL